MMAIKTEVQWDAPNGDKFRFEYKLEKCSGISSVKSVNGTIFLVSASNTTPGKGSEDSSSNERSKTEAGVGYLCGHLIERNNANFHSHGDAVSQELHEFTVSLYDSRGRTCRVPKTAFSKIKFSQGGMLLIEKIEHNSTKGIDLGINFLHHLLATDVVRKEAGVVVMNPLTLSEHGLHYKDNMDNMKKRSKGKNESEKVDISRQDTVKLRRQFSRMGFAAVQDSPAFVDQWFLAMEKYKSMKAGADMDVRSSWLSKEEVSKMRIPMSAKKHVDSDEDKALKTLLESIFSSPNSSISAMMLGMPYSNQSHTNSLSNSAKSEMKRLVEAGASLDGINALHMAAANYKSSDLFHHLVNEFGMKVNAFDEKGSLPIHVAACTSNIEAVRALLELGANKKAKNKDGLSALQLLEKQEESFADFRNVFGLSASTFGSMNPSSQQIKLLLR